MTRLITTLLLLGSLFHPAHATLTGSSIAGETAITFTTSTDETAEAWRGVLTVPENRSQADSRQIELHYVRFAATGEKPGSPIIYLAGGPGGSGIMTAQYTRRFPLFMAMREFGDVIAFDQRGTGDANTLPSCTSSVVMSATSVLSDVEHAHEQRKALTECVSFWKDADIDVRGYTTTESVQDLEALRQHLGATKISLWGISYGSHLALAALKTIESSIDRVILASVEGLDQTIKLPFETDAYFARLQAAVNQDPDMKAAFPDLVAMIRRVHDQLETKPLTLALPQKDSSSTDLTFQRLHMQQLSSYMIADPGRALQLLMLYSAVDQGITEPLAGVVSRVFEPGQAISFNPMSVLMDIASGIDPKREAVIMRQAQTSLLGTMLNDSIHLNAVLPEIDLGAEFRRKPVSAVPALILTGTLDGRTYPIEQADAVSGLSQVTTVIIENAGHNLFMVSDEVTEVIQEFMRGESVTRTRLSVPMPAMPSF